MKRRTALKSTVLSLLTLSTPVMAGREWASQMAAPAIESADDAIQLYGLLNGVTPANAETLVRAFPDLSPLLSAPCLGVGYAEASGESRAPQATNNALAHLLLTGMDSGSIHGIHIAIKSDCHRHGSGRSSLQCQSSDVICRKRPGSPTVASMMPPWVSGYRSVFLPLPCVGAEVTGHFR